MPRFQLTISGVPDSAWQDSPPGALDNPALYDGLLWRRVVGYLVDVCLVALLVVGLWIVMTLLSVLSFGLLVPVKIVTIAILPVAYHTYFIGRYGATPGMRMMDVEVRTWTGGRPDFFVAFLMTALFYASVSLTVWLILLVALFNDKHRTLHDYLAGTLGVRTSRLAGAPQAA